jgi:integrase
MEQLSNKLKNFKQDEFYQRWVNGLSPRTKENYNANFQGWLAFINMTPTEQINKRMQDSTSTNIVERQFFEDMFRKYKVSLEQRGDLKPSAIKSMLIPVASFFSRNGLKLQLKRGDWESTLTNEVQIRAKLTRDDVRQMYLHADLRDRALLLTLAQSGLSEVDVSCLKVESFPKLYTIPSGEHLFFEKRREKTNEMQATCLSAEALHDIKAMLSERGNPETGYLFTSRTYKQGEPLLVKTINEAMKKLAEKTFNKKRAKQFKTKQLRSFYNSALLSAGVQPQEIKDLMFGHQRRGARGHYDYDENTIVKNYKRVFEYMSVNGIQVKTDVAKLKAELESSRSESSKAIAQLQTELDTVKKYMSVFEDIIDKGELREFREWIEKKRKKEAQDEETKFQAEVTKENPVPKKTK